MSYEAYCDQCGKSPVPVTYFGTQSYCQECLFAKIDSGGYNDDNEIVASCDNCEEVIPNGDRTYCRGCAECSDCDSIADYCEYHASSYSECEESHGCHYCGEYDEVYCNSCAEKHWFNRECSDCGANDDVDHHYCMTCDGQRQYKDEAISLPVIEDGVIEVDGISVAWN